MVEVIEGVLVGKRRGFLIGDLMELIILECKCL